MRIWPRKHASGILYWWRDKDLGRNVPAKGMTVSGSDGAALPLTPEEFREAQARGRHGVCASQSCGRALDGNPWIIEITKEGKAAGTVSVCSEKCAREWIADQQARSRKG